MGTDNGLGPAKRQIGCSVYEANDHGFLLRQMVGRNAKAHTRESFTAAAKELMPLIERRVPVAFESFRDKFPVGAVIRRNNLRAISAVANYPGRDLCAQAVQDLLIAYGRNHYFEVDCTDLRLAAGEPMTLLQQSVAFNNVPAALAFIELGAVAEAPEGYSVAPPTAAGGVERCEDPDPGLRAFEEFVHQYRRRGRPAYEAIMGAVRARSMREEIARTQGLAPGAEAGAASVVGTPAPKSRRRGI